MSPMSPMSLFSLFSLPSVCEKLNRIAPNAYLYVVYNRGTGWSYGDYIVVNIYRGGGLPRWWTARNRGPGEAVTPGTPCGHAWPSHCNSAHCTNWYCGEFPRTAVFRWFLSGKVFRIWAGPTYHRRSPKEWLRVWRAHWGKAW